MRKQIIILTFLAIAICFSCSTNNDTPTGTGSDEVLVQALYRITFTTSFTTEFHPTDYPDNAMFIKPFIVAHNANTSIYKEGSLASPGLKLYAEEGDATTLVTEHSSGGDTNATTIIQGTTDVGPTETKVYNINVTPNTTLISFITKLSPSPDWFLGVDSINILNSDNTLVDNIGFKLYAIDAGTDAGETYTSANSSETKVIAVKTGLPLSTVPNDAGKFLATISIERVINN